VSLCVFRCAASHEDIAALELVQNCKRIATRFLVTERRHCPSGWAVCPKALSRICTIHGGTMLKPGWTKSLFNDKGEAYGVKAGK
jgi:hypothetical protein